MPARPADLTLARGVAERIVALEGSRVQRVMMIGSRALGTARPDSDLDLVVLVEPPAGMPPWRSADFAAEGARLRARIRPALVRADLWVRTTDRFAEVREVVGGVEWLAAHEGVEVFSRPAARPPNVVLTTEQIRCQNVSAWVEHTCLALDAAHRLGNAAAVSGRAPDSGDPVVIARLACARALTAALVAYGVHAPASAGLDAQLERLSRADPELATMLRSRLGHVSDVAVALDVVRRVVARLSQDPRLARYLATPRERLSRTVFVLR